MILVQSCQSNMESFQNSNAKSIVMDMVHAIQRNKDELSRIDGLIGDGDHGINMNKGFTICEERIKDKQTSFTDALSTLGNILFSEIGGSMGPLYGNLFICMSDAADNVQMIDKYTYMKMLDAGVLSINELSDAKVGDKTMLDVLYPAKVTFAEAVQYGDSFAEALEKMELTVTQARDNTSDMIAKIGRAARLGERSRGVVDVGAASCALLLNTMADSIIKLLSV